MNLTESELLQARIAGMSNFEFDEWLAGQIEPHVNEAYSSGRKDGYHEGEQAAKRDYSHGWDDGYEEGYNDEINE